jgi:hypothetical protein
VLDTTQVTRSCSQCGTGNQSAAEFCCTCGESLPVANFPNTVAVADEQIVLRDHETRHSVSPRAALERLLLSMTPDQAASRLNELILMHRRQLKSHGDPFPSVNNPVVGALLKSLKVLPPREISARIAIVNAMGQMEDPSALSPLFLTADAPSKEVRKATAKALGCIKHPLSAYLLLRMLQDSSTRVSQAAFQSLIRLDQPHTSEVILAACLSSKSFRKLILEIVRLISDRKRHAFFMRIKESEADNQPELKIVANWLRFEFRNALSPDCLPDETTPTVPDTQAQSVPEFQSLVPQEEKDCRSDLGRLPDSLMISEHERADNRLTKPDASETSDEQDLLETVDAGEWKSTESNEPGQSLDQENDLDSNLKPQDEIDNSILSGNTFETDSESELENSSSGDVTDYEQNSESNIPLRSEAANRELEKSKNRQALETSQGKSDSRSTSAHKKRSGTKHRRYIHATVAVAVLFVVAPLLLVVLSLNGEAPSEDITSDEPIETRFGSKPVVPPTRHHPEVPVIAELKMDTSSSIPQQSLTPTLIASQPTASVRKEESSPSVAVPEITLPTPIIRDVPQPIDVAPGSIEIDSPQPLPEETNEHSEEPVVADTGMLELPAKPETGVNYYEVTGHLAMRTPPQVPDPEKNQTPSAETKQETQNESDSEVGAPAKGRTSKTRKPRTDENESVESIVAEAKADSKRPIERLLPGNNSKTESKTVIEDVAIQTPIESTPVGRFENVVAMTNAKGWPIALIRSDLPDDVWWVQQVVGIQGNAFAARVNFGNEYSLSGSEFRMVIVFLDSPDEVRRFRIAKQFKDIPEGTRRSREFHYIRN